MIPTSSSAIASIPELSGFKWVRSLDSRGFADVYLYHQLLPSRDVAIKVVRSLNDERGAAELRREANTMAAVAGHPVIVPLHGAGITENGRPLLVMEYYPVANMGEQVRTCPMSIDQALNVMVQINGGVEMLHHAGIVHRDIKPVNIILGSYGHPALADFGVASPIGILADGVLDGFSVLWVPPEQQGRRTHIHPTQDVWALASTTWTPLTGCSPFKNPFGDSSAVAVTSRAHSGHIRGLGRVDTPEELERVLLHAMRLDPLERTPCVARSRRALQGIQRLIRGPVTRLEICNPYLEVTSPPPMGILDGVAAFEQPDERGSAQAKQDTRLCLFPSTDPDQTRLRAGSFDPDSGIEAHTDAWREPKSATTTGRVGIAQRDVEPRRVSAWGISALAVVAAVIVTGLVVAMFTGGGQRVLVAPSPIDQKTEALDPVDAPPAPVISLSGRVEDGRVTWVWIGVEKSRSNSQSEPGFRVAKTNHYVYTVLRPGEDSILNNIDANAVALMGVPGENRSQVVAVGERGRQSSVVEECMNVE